MSTPYTEVDPKTGEPRWKKLQRLMKGWTPHYEDSHRWWELWKASSYMAYPFAGARLDQPQAVLDDFDAYDLLSEMYTLLEKAPKVKGLPRLFGDGKKR